MTVQFGELQYMSSNGQVLCLLTSSRAACGGADAAGTNAQLRSSPSPAPFAEQGHSCRPWLQNRELGQEVLVVHSVLSVGRTLRSTPSARGYRRDLSLERRSEGRANRVNLRFLEKRGWAKAMQSTRSFPESVRRGLRWLVFDRATLGPQTSAGPAAVAVANGADFLESQLLLESLCASEDLRLTDLLAVAAKEGHQVEFLRLFWIREGVWVDDFSTEAVLVNPMDQGPLIPERTSQADSKSHRPLRQSGRPEGEHW